MRVCSPQIGVDPDANLGGAVYDRELLRAMVQEGAQVDVLLPEGSPVDVHAGWSIEWTPRHRHNYYEYNFIFLRALRRRWRRQSADILRVHSPYSVGPGALVFAREAGVPVALHYLHREPRPLWKMIDRCTLGRYDLIVTISAATLQDLLGLGISRTKIVLAYPGVEEKYSPAPHRPVRDELLAVYVGGLLRRKNLTLALRAVALARRSGTIVVLVVAGEGPEEAELRAEAARLDLGAAVRFAGRISEPEKVELLRTADVFLFPSLLEGFGMAAVEALACGTPVIALRRTAAAETVRHEVTGLLLDTDDPAEMAAAIRQMAANRALRDSLGAAAHTDVRERFSWRRSASQVLSAYARVAAGRSRA